MRLVVLKTVIFWHAKFSLGSRIYIYKVCSKRIETEVVFTKTEMNKEWNIVLLASTHLFQWVFHWSKHIKTLFWYGFEAASL